MNIMEQQLGSLAKKMVNSAEEDNDARTIRNMVIIHLILSKIMEAQVTISQSSCVWV